MGFILFLGIWNVSNYDFEMLNDGPFWNITEILTSIRLATEINVEISVGWSSSMTF